MEHEMKGLPLRGIASRCECDKGAIAAIITDEEVLIRITHVENDVITGCEEATLSPAKAMKFAIDMLGPALYGMRN